MADDHVVRNLVILGTAKVGADNILVEGAVIDETAQDAVGTILTDSGRVDFTYDDATPSITADIVSASVANSYLANMSQNTFKGRVTAGDGAPEDLTPGQVRSALNVADGANNYSHPNHTGDVTSTGDGVTVIAAGAVTNAKLDAMSSSTLKGRISVGSGDPEDLTAANVRTIINVEDGADVTDETNVVAALDGAVLTAVTVATGDKVIIQDVSNSDNIKTVTAQSIADLASGNDVETQDEGIQVNAATTIVDFVGAGVTASDGGGGKTTVTIPGGGSVAISDEGTQVLAGPSDVNFAGGGVTASDDLDGTVTVTIPGGGSTSVSEEGTQVLAGPSDINFAGQNVTASDDGDGTVTITINADNGNADTVDGDHAADLKARANHTGTQASSTISDFNEAVDDRVGAAFAAGTQTNITVTYDDVNNLFDFSVPAASTTVKGVAERATLAEAQAGTDTERYITPEHLADGLGGKADTSHTHASTDITDFNEAAQDTVGGILTDTATVDFTYNDGANTITADVKSASVSNSLLSNAAAWTIKLRNAATTGSVSDAALADLTAEAAPDAGDFLLGFLATGEIRKFDIDNLPSSGGGSIAIEEEGTEVLAAATRINFIGSNVTAADAGAGEASVTINADGGDAATLDGIDSTQFLRSDQSDTISGSLTVDSAAGANAVLSESGIDRSNASNQTFNIQNSGAGSMSLQVDGVTVLTTADEGAGNGLDADTLDSIQAAGFLRSDATDNYTSGTLTFNVGTTVDLLGTTKTDAISESTAAAGVTVDSCLIKDGSVADSLLLQGQNSAYHLARANHTGTQTASTISDFSEAVDDRVDALIVDGSNITTTYDDVANTLTIAVDSTGLDADTFDTLNSTQFLRSDATDNYTAGTLTLDVGTTIDIKGTCKTDAISESTAATGVTVDSCLIKDGSVADSLLLQGQNSAYHLARANHTGTQTAATISDFDEAAQDAIGNNMLSGIQTNITVTYDDPNGELDFVVPAASTTTAGVVERATDAEVQAGTDTSRYVTPEQVVGLAKEYTKQQNFNATTLTDGATINWNLDDNQVAKVTLGGNRTMAAPTNMKDGATYILRVIQDATGTRTITWNAVFKWPGGTAPTLSTGNGDIDIITFVSDGTNMYGVFQGDFS